jgi:hypothetical protein
MTLTALADIRELVERHLPAECRERDTWQQVAAQSAGDMIVVITICRVPHSRAARNDVEECEHEHRSTR